MRREPTTESPPAIDCSERELDAVLGVYTLFLRIPRFESDYFRVIVESWEDFAVARTVQRFCDGDASRSVVVVMAVPDFVAPCARALAQLCAEIDGVQIASTPALREALRRDLLDDHEEAEAEPG